MPGVIGFIIDLVIIVVGVFQNPIVQAALALLAVDAATRKPKSADFGSDADLRRESVIRTAIGPKNVIYGQTLVGGILTYMNTEDVAFTTIWVNVSHAGHEVEDITDLFFYDDFVGSSNISWGNGVTGGEYFIDGTPYVYTYKRLGTSTQTAIPEITAAFADKTADHRGRGVAYSAIKLILAEESAKVFEANAPQKLRALVSGKNDIYDPRLDVSPGADPTNPAYQAYTTNPILCAANYLTDIRVGAKYKVTRINWDMVADEADYCDVQVPSSVADVTAKRFTCNGLLVTTADTKENLRELLTSCNGRFSYRSGKFNIRAGRLGSGPNLVTNPTFDTNVTGWVLGVNGAVQGITTVINTAYTVRATVKSSSNESNLYQLAKSDNADGSAPSVTYAGTSEDISLRLTFIATATTSYICLNNTAAAASSITWDSSNGGQLKVTDSGSGTAGFDDVEFYLVSGTVVNEDWMAGDLALQSITPKNQRFNTSQAFYFSPDEKYQKVESQRLENSDFVADRDNGDPLFKTFSLPFTDSEDEAQRIVYKRIQGNDEQKVLRVPSNYKALNIAVHDFVLMSFADLRFVNKIFRVINWRLNEGQSGVATIFIEDSEDAYIDPDISEYITRTASGGININTPVVAEPTSAIVTSKEGGNLVEWVNPTIAEYYDVTEIWGGAASNFGSATLLDEVRGTSYLHKLDSGENRYYWVRSRKANDFSSEVATTPTNATAGDLLGSASQAQNVEDGADVTLDQLAGSGINMFHPQYSSEVDSNVDLTDLPNATTVIDDTNSYFGTGNGVIKVTASGAVAGVSLGSSHTGYNVIIPPNKKWILSGQLKHSLASKTVQLWIRTSDATYNGGGFTSSVTPDTYELESIAIDLSANNSTSLLCYVVNEGVTGDAYFDALMLEEQIGVLETPSAYSKPAPRIGVDQDLGATDNSDTILATGSLVEGLAIFDGATIRTGSKGLDEQSARDGDSVTFSTSWNTVPDIIFKQGGLSWSAALVASPEVDQSRDFQAKNLTVSGFDAYLKLKTLPGALTNRTDNTVGSPVPPAGPDETINKDQTLEAFDDNYLYQLDIVVGNILDSPGVYRPGTVVVGFYTNDGGGWVLRATVNYRGSGGGSSSTSFTNETKLINVDGLGLGDDYGISIESASVPGSSSINFDQVTYQTATAGSVTSATPTGVSDVNYNVQGVA